MYGLQTTSNIICAERDMVCQAVAGEANLAVCQADFSPLLTSITSERWQQTETKQPSTAECRHTLQSH